MTKGYVKNHQNGVCTGDHSAASKQCAMWIKEKETQKIRCTKRISFLEAKKMTFTPVEAQ